MAVLILQAWSPVIGKDCLLSPMLCIRLELSNLLLVLEIIVTNMYIVNCHLSPVSASLSKLPPKPERCTSTSGVQLLYIKITWPMFQNNCHNSSFRVILIHCKLVVLFRFWSHGKQNNCNFILVNCYKKSYAHFLEILSIFAKNGQTTLKIKCNFSLECTKKTSKLKLLPKLFYTWNDFH